MKFTSIACFHIKGVGKVFVIENPQECQDFQWLLGEHTIDGQSYVIHRVGHNTVMPPFLKGFLLEVAVNEATIDPESKKPLV